MAMAIQKPLTQKNLPRNSMNKRRWKRETENQKAAANHQCCDCSCLFNLFDFSHWFCCPDGYTGECHLCCQWGHVLNRHQQRHSRGNWQANRGKRQQKGQWNRCYHKKWRPELWYHYTFRFGSAQWLSSHGQQHLPLLWKDGFHRLFYTFWYFFKASLRIPDIPDRNAKSTHQSVWCLSGFSGYGQLADSQHQRNQYRFWQLVYQCSCRTQQWLHVWYRLDYLHGRSRCLPDKAEWMDGCKLLVLRLYSAVSGR